MELIKNKIGADKILSVYWFATIFIISAGIFAMIYAFYGSPFDIRDVEARTMTEKIAECISLQGTIAPEIFQSLEQQNKTIELSNLCHLNFNSEFSGIQYYAEAVFYDFKSFSENPQNPISSVSAGNANLKADCELQKTEDFEKISKCSESRIYALDGKNNPYIIKILSVVRKTEKNARQ